MSCLLSCQRCLLIGFGNTELSTATHESTREVERAMNRRIFALLTLLSAMLLLSTLSFGQAISGDLTGVVKDATGAYVSDADVTVTSLGTGFKENLKTNAQGEYHFVNLPVGHYSVDVNAPGMKGGFRDVEVVLNKIATANITTAVVSGSTTVEVNEQAVAIDTTTPTISTTFGRQAGSRLAHHLDRRHRQRRAEPVAARRRCGQLRRRRCRHRAVHRRTASSQ